MEYSKEEFIKETGLSEKDLQELKEAFKEKFVAEKGWDKNNLSQEQLIELINQEGYKNAGKLFS